MAIPVTSKIDVKELRVNRPWKLRAGVRFADRVAPRPASTGDGEGHSGANRPISDPLQDERWDIELDAEYQYNSRLEKQQIQYPSIQKLKTQAAANPTTGVIPDPAYIDFPAKLMVDGKPVPATNSVEKHWKDQVSLRLGGTYNILRGILGLSAGVHWENRGIDPDYMQVDFWPVSRIGIHGGIIIRVRHSVDLSLSYAHIFQEDIVVKPPTHLSANQIYNNKLDPTKPQTVNIDKSVGVSGSGEGRSVLEEPPVKHPDGSAKLEQEVLLGAAGMPKWITNSGTYRSYYNVIAAGVNFHF
jgi:hypothetical protein